MGLPFIHTLSLSSGFYVYDVNMNKILKVPKNIYQKLRNWNDDEITSDNEIKKLKELGFLKDNRVNIVEHPATKYLEYYLGSNVEQLVLQVTQNCNLRCKYCLYTEDSGYNNRKHSNKRMSWETAQKALDFYLMHSKSVNPLLIGFYGGEPLLEISLIEKCVNYVKDKHTGKDVQFNLTTNGTLITESVASFLVKNDFSVMISFDGPKEIQNSSRILKDSETGSYEVVIKNLKALKDKYPEYYSKRVSFNTVLYSGGHFKDIDNFFNQESLFEDAKLMCSFTAGTYIDKKNNMSQVYMEEYYYTIFLVFLHKVGWFGKQESPSRLLRKQENIIGNIEELELDVSKYSSLPSKWHRSGPCIPGVFRMFVSVEGKIYPCERVSELSDVACIGDISTGIDNQKVIECLNIERFTKDKCKDCWAYRLCGLCVTSLDCFTELCGKCLEEKCIEFKCEQEETLKDYIALKELGYDFEKNYLEEE